MRIACGLAAWLALFPAAVVAQAELPALSNVCSAPDADIANPVPLPRLAERIQKREEVKILAIGSSSTWGVGATSRRRAYPAQLQAILETALHGARPVIVNRGVSGEVAQMTAERLRTEVALEQPDLVLWQVGTNDALSRVPVGDFERTVSETIDWLKQHNVDVVIVGLQYTPQAARDDNYIAIREALKRVTATRDVLFVRRYDAMQFIARTAGVTSLVSDDELHLNDTGYRCMAEHVAHAVIASLFLRRRDLPKQEGK